MTVKLISYVHFNGNAREAAEFYQSIFGGDLEMSTFGEFASEQMPIGDEDKDKIMHAFLKGDNGLSLMMSDTPSHMEYNDGSRMSIAINTDDEASGKAYWERLTEGGVVAVPLMPSMWNSTFGMCVDKFGVDWMIDIGEMRG